jgi:hypothetical protein
VRSNCEHPVLIRRPSEHADGHGQRLRHGEPARSPDKYDATISAPTGTSTYSGLAFFTLSEIAITGSCPTGTSSVRIGGFDKLLAVSDRLASTRGQSNGGGQVVGPGSDPVTFAFNARSKNSVLSGGCNVLDHDTQRHIKCKTVTRYIQTGNAVTIRGQATDTACRRST